MDNRNQYQTNPYMTPSGYYPSYYPAATAPVVRQEVPSYMIQQPAASAFLKGRPVTSLEEARVAQIDLDGSVTFFPDLGNKKIYTKRINIDGTASLQVYSLEVPTQVQEAQPAEYATKDELLEIKSALGEVLERLKSSSPKINL